MSKRSFRQLAGFEKNFCSKLDDFVSASVCIISGDRASFHQTNTFFNLYLVDLKPINKYNIGDC